MNSSHETSKLENSHLLVFVIFFPRIHRIVPVNKTAPHFNKKSTAQK